jgi:hypothetical protein
MEEIDTFYGRDKSLLLPNKFRYCYDLRGGNPSKQLAVGN